MSKETPLHRFWRRRVEGQIRDVMFKHPEWFVSIAQSQRGNFVRSLSKRIVGEIVAAAQGGHDTGRHG